MISNTTKKICLKKCCCLKSNFFTVHTKLFKLLLHVREMWFQCISRFTVTFFLVSLFLCHWYSWEELFLDVLLAHWHVRRGVKIRVWRQKTRKCGRQIHCLSMYVHVTLMHLTWLLPPRQSLTRTPSQCASKKCYLLPLMTHHVCVDFLFVYVGMFIWICVIDDWWARRHFLSMWTEIKEMMT